jgi:hypothetical protein
MTRSRYRPAGRLRVLLGPGARGVNISASINGHQLLPSTNSSALYDEGAQAALGRFPDSSYRAFHVSPAAQLADGNNTIAFVVGAPPPPPSEAGYTLTYTGAHGLTHGLRFRFPYPHTSRTYKGPRVVGSASSQPTLEACQQSCDTDHQCRGVYYGYGGLLPSRHSPGSGGSPAAGTTCYALHTLVQAGTGLAGLSYTKSGRTAPVAAPAARGSSEAAPIHRLELSLPVTPP